MNSSSSLGPSTRFRSGVGPFTSSVSVVAVLLIVASCAGWSTEGIVPRKSATNPQRLGRPGPGPGERSAATSRVDGGGRDAVTLVALDPLARSAIGHAIDRVRRSSEHPCPRSSTAPSRGAAISTSANGSCAWSSPRRPGAPSIRPPSLDAPFAALRTRSPRRATTTPTRSARCCGARSGTPCARCSPPCRCGSSPADLVAGLAAVPVVAVAPSAACAGCCPRWPAQGRRGDRLDRPRRRHGGGRRRPRRPAHQPRSGLRRAHAAASCPPRAPPLRRGARARGRVTTAHRRAAARPARRRGVAGVALVVADDLSVARWSRSSWSRRRSSARSTRSPGTSPTCRPASAR